MERYNVNFTVFALHVLLFTLFTCSPTATSQGGSCSMIFCGQGTCRNSSSSLLGFECDCYSGWSKIQVGPLTFPSCLIPNCTMNMQCGNGSPPPPPPSVAFPPPPLNLTNPCNLVWCGEGTCMRNGTGHICQCNEGSSNLVNNTQLPCLQQCNFGADCRDLGFGFGTPNPSAPPSSSNGNATGNGMPSPQSSSLPPSNLDLGGNDVSEASNSLSRLGAVRMILLLAATSLTFLQRINQE